jgi:hypothetical protein
MKTIYRMVWVAAFTATALAGDVIPSLSLNQQLYQDVTFGAVNQGKVAMYHSRGTTIVDVEALPSYLRGQLGYGVPGAPVIKPASPISPPTVIVSRAETAPRPVNPPPQRATDFSTAELAAFRCVEGTTVVFRGRLVDRSTLTELTGFLTKAKIPGVSEKADSWVLELAVKTGKVPKQLELRPALWKRTGESAVLKGYQPDDLAEACGFARTYGLEIEKVNGLRAYEVGVPPTYQQWKQLQAGNR